MRKTVLISGCSSGFGKALCREFKEQGYFRMMQTVKIRCIGMCKTTGADQ